MTEGLSLFCFSFCAAIGQLWCIHVSVYVSHFFWTVVEF